MRVKLVAAATAVLALVAHGQVLAQSAAPELAPVMLSAGDRVEAAIAWSRHGVADGQARTALLAREDDFADALASGTAQVQEGAPLLLTATHALDDRVAAELERLGAEQVVLLGGTAALSEAVARAVRDRGYDVERVAGADRITTAVAVAERFADAAEPVVLARAFGAGDDPTRAFADSLAAGPTGTLLLTATAELSQATENYLVDNGVTSVEVAGGEAAVSATVAHQLTQLGIAVDRHEGPSRFATAAALTFIRHPQHPPVGYILVDGTSPDAWAAGLPAALSAARTATSIVLTAGATVPSVTARLLLQKDRVVCAPLLPTEACNTAGLLQSASGTFSPGGSLVAAARSTALSGPSALVHILRTDRPGTFCYRYDPLDIGTLATVRVAELEGPVVADLTLDTGGFRSDDPPRGYGCVGDANADVVERLLTEPRRFRAELLARDGRSVVGPFATIARDRASAFGQGADVVGGGDPDAFLSAEVLFTDAPGEVCVLYRTDGIDETITGAHLHTGASGDVGPILAELPVPTPSGAAACVNADPDTVAGMPDDMPTYLDVHTAGHRDGAARAAVRRPPPPPVT